MKGLGIGNALHMPLKAIILQGLHLLAGIILDMMNACE